MSSILPVLPVRATKHPEQGEIPAGILGFFGSGVWVLHGKRKGGVLLPWNAGSSTGSNRVPRLLSNV